jgi:hypothetical protein
MKTLYEIVFWNDDGTIISRTVLAESIEAAIELFRRGFLDRSKYRLHEIKYLHRVNIG